MVTATKDRLIFWFFISSCLFFIPLFMCCVFDKPIKEFMVIALFCMSYVLYGAICIYEHYKGL